VESLSRLVKLMDRLAVTTWWSLVDAHDLNMDWGEVTATHTNLLAIARLARESGLSLQIERITQARERSLGADWEFWLQLQAGEALGYSIQAKRVYEQGGSLQYSELGHRGERSTERQYDTLIRHAEAQGAHPFHVFYNGWPLNGASVSFADTRADVFFGCAAVSSYEVRRVRNTYFRRGANRVDRYAGISMPWSDLFRVQRIPPGSGDGRAGGGGGNSGPFATPQSGPGPTARLRPAAMSRAGLEALSNRLANHSAAKQPVLRDGLPDYILKAPLLAAQGDLPARPELPQFAIVAKAV
jgi:hypothetical protein